MPKSATITGKIKFVMLEAEIVDGNLSEIAQAITNAVAPAPIVQRVLPSAAVSSRGPTSAAQASDLKDTATLFPDEDPEHEPLRAPTRRGGANRKYPEPKVLDLDLTSGPTPWESFARQKAPSDTTKKFLVVAAWLKEHGSIPSITADHVYTCFKIAGWGTSFKDFGAPFRQLKRQGWVNSSKPGHFEINHVGVDTVKKMGRTA